MPTYTGLSVFSDLLLVRGAFWGNGLAASCTLQTPLPGERYCIIRTGAEPYSLKCRIPSRRILLENRASGRNCLINDWKAPRLWFGDTKDALIGLLGLALATHETPEYGPFRFIGQFLYGVLGNQASGITLCSETQGIKKSRGC